MADAKVCIDGATLATAQPPIAITRVTVATEEDVTSPLTRYIDPIQNEKAYARHGVASPPSGRRRRDSLAPNPTLPGFHHAVTVSRS